MESSTSRVITLAMSSLAAWKGRYNRDSDWPVRSSLGTEDSGRGQALLRSATPEKRRRFFPTPYRAPAKSETLGDQPLKQWDIGTSGRSNVSAG